jgi:hypothetical protein
VKKIITKTSPFQFKFDSEQSMRLENQGEDVAAYTISIVVRIFPYVTYCPFETIIL